MIKAIFFDIDGTLIEAFTKVIHQDTLDTLYKLHENGIKLFICSGRAPVHIQILEERIRNIPWDGYVMLNGSLVHTGNHEELFRKSLAKEDLEVFLPWFKQSGIISSFAEIDYSYDNIENIFHASSPNDSSGKFYMPVDDCERALTHETFMLCPRIPAERDDEFTSHLPNSRSVRWNPEFADVIPSTSGKAVGMKYLLDYYGLSLEDCAAFGDGGNDIEMLEAVGLGIAMGNAKDEVKKHANMITSDVKDEGITYACKQLKLI